MELNDKVNDSYIKDKQAYQKLDKLKVELKNTQKELLALKRLREDAEKSRERAKEDGNKSEEHRANIALGVIKKEIEKRITKIEKMKEIITKNKEKVDSYINELNKNPEFKAHLNSILEKRYNRQMKKAIKEKEQVNMLIDLCLKHPSLENNLKGMIRANEELKKLDDELGRLDPVTDAVRINEIQNIEIPTLTSKNNMNKKIFMDFCNKNSIVIDENFLEKMVKENGFAHDKTGDIKVSKTLKNISKGYDKKIVAYKNSVEKISGAKVYEENQESIGDSGNGGLPVPKFKWWQFGKKNNAWREQRKVRTQIKEEEGKTKSSEKFRNAYKYDVVKDYIDKKENEIYKESAKEARKKDSEDLER